MDIKEYISSGIVESYVLGLASSEERSAFEKLCLEFPELVAARDDFEIALEARLLGLAVAPAHEVKEKVMSNIRQQSLRNQTKVITMEKSTTNSSSSSLKWVAAASIILLLGAGYFAYDFYKKNKKLESQLADTKKTLEGTAEDKAKMDEALQSMISDPNVAVVSLKAAEKAPTSANIYWDSTSSNVYLVVKNLPKLPSEKQYQLWSIINGQNGLEPTSLGLFDMGDGGKFILKAEKGTNKADMFAISVENRGNAGGPTMAEIKAIGKTAL